MADHDKQRAERGEGKPDARRSAPSRGPATLPGEDAAENKCLNRSPDHPVEHGGVAAPLVTPQLVRDARRRLDELGGDSACGEREPAERARGAGGPDLINGRFGPTSMAVSVVVDRVMSPPSLDVCRDGRG